MDNDTTNIGNRPLCPKCHAEMKLTSNGKLRPPRFKCQACHTKAVREKYPKSRNRAVRKYRMSWKYPIARKRCALKAEGVASYTSVESKRSELHAHNARQLWTTTAEDLVVSGKYTQGQLSKILGRSIRAVQHKRARLRTSSIKAAEMALDWEKQTLNTR